MYKPNYLLQLFLIFASNICLTLPERCYYIYIWGSKLTTTSLALTSLCVNSPPVRNSQKLPLENHSSFASRVVVFEASHERKPLIAYTIAALARKTNQEIFTLSFTLQYEVPGTSAFQMSTHRIQILSWFDGSFFHQTSNFSRCPFTYDFLLL